MIEDSESIIDNENRLSFICDTCGKEFMMSPGHITTKCYNCGGRLKHEWF